MFQMLSASTLGKIINKTTSQKCPQRNTKILKNAGPTYTVIPLNCTAYDHTRTCPSTKTIIHSREDPHCSSDSTCPEYFRWINEDLRPWAHTGVSRDMIEKVKDKANFRLVIVNGKAYVEKYRKPFQTRDVSTLWGILQLLRRYPGKVPDLELMFNCNDRPVIISKDYTGINGADPPPLFRYCSDDATLDIPFPDWTFWGW